LKSHGPRTFERAENSLEHRGPQVFTRRSCSLCSSQSSSRDACPCSGLVSPAAVWIVPELSSTERHPICRRARALEAASSKQSSENRTVRRLGGAGDGPADRAPKSALSWLVHQGRGGVVTPHIPVLDVGTSR